VLGVFGVVKQRKRLAFWNVRLYWSMFARRAREQLQPRFHFPVALRSTFDATFDR